MATSIRPSVMLCGLFGLALMCIVIEADVVEHDFVLERKMVNMDGVVRDALTVNQQVIGPTIEATVGDNLLITVTNRCLMQEVISIHWHGIHQTGTPWADGAAFVTNCPITAGSSYTYNFTANAPGTYWYHVHSGSLREEGSNGLLIVYSQPSHDPTELVQTPTQFGTLPYDEEIHIVLNDRYSKSVYVLNAMIDNNPFMKVGNGNTIYINGEGESQYCSYNGTTSTVTTTSTDGASNTVSTTCKGQREVFSFQRDKTYLVRVVNAAFLAFFNLAIAGHYFTIVGVDGGSYTEPVDVNSLDLSAGQRVMALLRFNHTPADGDNSNNADTYLMRAQTDWGGIDNSHAGIVHAYVTYSDPALIPYNPISPLEPPNQTRNWHEWYDLVTPHSATVNDCPSSDEVTRRFQIDGKIQYVDSSTGTGLTPPSLSPGMPNTRESWTVYNNSRLMMPATPYLLASYLARLNNTVFVTNEHERSKRTSSSARAYVASKEKRRTSSVGYAETKSPMTMAPALKPLRVELDDVVEVVVQAYASGSGGCDLHPWHLHGHTFWLVSRGDGLYNASSGTGSGATAAANTYTSARPLKMDTVSGYPARHSDTRTGKSRGVWNDPCGWFVIRFRADNPGMWLFHCHIGWHMEMGMAVVFDEASELVAPPPSDYGMYGAAGEIGVLTTLLKEAASAQAYSDGDKDTSSHENLQHGATFQVLVAFLVLLSVVASGAVLGLFIVWQRTKGLGMFHQINPHSQHIDEIENPLSEHASNSEDLYSRNSRVQHTQSSNFTELSGIDDELEEIDFHNHTHNVRKLGSFQPLQMGDV